MDRKTEKKVEKLSAEAPDILEGIESAVEEEASFDEIENVKSLAAAFMARYEGLLKRLSLEEQKEVLQSLGAKVGEIEERLTDFREAPE